ncbi:MAG: hypothetical protein LBT40_06420 [Deltaproteobacteria bacterium]|nr:hypothetical protein [Deltaproteobacteria bacterium]
MRLRRPDARQKRAGVANMTPHPKRSESQTPRQGPALSAVEVPRPRCPRPSPMRERGMVWEASGTRRVAVTESRPWRRLAPAQEHIELPRRKTSGPAALRNMPGRAAATAGGLVPGAVMDEVGG